MVTLGGMAGTVMRHHGYFWAMGVVSEFQCWLLECVYIVKIHWVIYTNDFYFFLVEYSGSQNALLLHTNIPLNALF